MVTIYTENEIETLAEGGKILSAVLWQVTKEVKPGVSTLELDKLAEDLLRKDGAEPAFLGFAERGSRPYPASLCTSVNEELVHCIPSKNKILQAGDIISLDLGACYKNLITDMAITVPVGKISSNVKKLLTVTEQCLAIAIAEAKEGSTTGDIGHAIETLAAEEKFAVIRDLVGHGVGHTVHEEPQVPNYGKKGAGVGVQAGMVIAIEPMLSQGGATILALHDGWGIGMADSSICAHFEKTVAITEKGARILTP